MSAVRSLCPPWILFIDQGRPVAILPAGRPGEVMKVDDMSLEDAQRIVNQANDIWRLVTVEHLKKALEGLDLLREQVTLELEARKQTEKPSRKPRQG